MRLSAEIREEHCPLERVRLEARYKVEAAALADLSLDVNESKLLGIHTEIVAAFGEIVAQPMDVADLTRVEWKRIHKALLIARRRSAYWLSISRRFGAERWGQGYVADAEAVPTTAPAATT